MIQNFVIQGLATLGVCLLSLIIVGWGTRSLIPGLINRYGFDYFGWERPYQPGYLFNGLVVLAHLGLLGWISVSQPLFSMPGWALVTVALQGTWRLDRRFQVIPDRLQGLGAFGAVWVVFTTLPLSEDLALRQFVTDTGTAWLLVACLWGLSATYEKIRRRPALGLGDIKLLGWLSLLLGPGLATVLCGSMALAVAAILPLLLWKRSKWDGTFAFGPFIVAAVCVYALLPALPTVMYALGARGWTIP